jgi:thiamine transport system substrate-binding protein
VSRLPSIQFELFASLFAVASFFPCAYADNPPELTIYVYDSFAAPGGLGPEVFPRFEKKCGCHLRVLPSGDGSQLLSRLALDQERGHIGAQLVIGLDVPTSKRALPYVDPYAVDKLYQSLAPEVRTALVAGFVPYDYGYFAFIADRDTLKKLNLAVPTHFSEVLRPEWKRNLILEDPRTSTPGLAFLLYSSALKVNGAQLKTQWLTLAPGWDGAYGIFMKGAAPLVWSYTTSQAYHEAHGDQARRYQAVLFEEGQPMQVESAALVRGGFSGVNGLKQRKLAESFLEFLLSPEVQALVPERNWMYPARKNVDLPPSFQHLSKPKRVVGLASEPAAVQHMLDQWIEQIQ